MKSLRAREWYVLERGPVKRVSACARIGVPMLQTILPDRVTRLTDTELDDRIHQARERLGRRLVILGHHYQRDEVIKFADVRGDSF